MSTDGDDDRVAALRRWEMSGAVWQVLSRTPSQVTVALCRCDGGEEVERFTSREPALLAYLGGRVSSDSTGGDDGGAPA